MTNSSEYWAEVETIFAAALDLHPDERSDLLDRCCAGRPGLRVEIESLLEAHSRATTIEPVNAGSDGASHPDARLGSVIGPFRLVELIGTGGMIRCIAPSVARQVSRSRSQSS